VGYCALSSGVRPHGDDGRTPRRREQRKDSGVNTILPSSILASSGSPARTSRRRRSDPRRTTCPLEEPLVCVIRRPSLVDPLSPRILLSHNQDFTELLQLRFVRQFSVRSVQLKAARTRSHFSPTFCGMASFLISVAEVVHRVVTRRNHRKRSALFPLPVRGARISGRPNLY
jgi:hypothetical protein